MEEQPGPSTGDRRSAFNHRRRAARTINTSPTAQDAVEDQDLVQEPEKDVATTSHLEMMKVGVQGRCRFQKIYIRGTKKSTTAYKPEADAPADDRTLSIIPTEEEKQGRPETTQYLVVGFVLAANPSKYTPKSVGNSSRNKDREQARKARGTLDAERNIIRAVVPMTEFVSDTIKYYAACHSTHGLCTLRVILVDDIFFFDEFWRDVVPSGKVKDRKARLSLACKYHAAYTKKPPEKPRTIIRKPDNSTASNAIAVTRETNAANVLFLQYSLWQLSGQPQSLTALEKTLESLLPDLAKMPAKEGTIAFFEFDSEMVATDASKLVEEAKIMYPSLRPLDPDLVMSLHTALRNSGKAMKLPYGSLGLFLEFGHDRAKAGWAMEILEPVVVQILHDIELFNRVHTGPSLWTPSNVTAASANLTPFVSSLRSALSEIKDFLLAQAVGLREQHGGVQQHQSLDDLMAKIGNCVDKEALMALHEQFFAIHGEQLATANSKGADYINELIDFIDMALGAQSVNNTQDGGSGKGKGNVTG
ncbi:hypothetical protein SNOG_10663 [Parastagonospora nodorum SN15]|uniref:Uncharacterized protein n=1 Tax=Phaeosphaeria nodorum (strain SN15 / ATCC MYA-4574 / FGSC 10173) TaxID=321614 RepID=Q0UC51_PHANO|nr:hypothetical protein SNOG_10663 [Parastagonospora nodorum SN15]EAT82057.2 hypothetical protein SNOG_10663 [Parastagonospora nodorum SN15]